MMQPERIEDFEDFRRFWFAKASAESAMASRIERSIEPTIGTAIAGDLPETEGTTVYFPIRNNDNITNIIGSFPSTTVVRVLSDLHKNTYRFVSFDETTDVVIGAAVAIAGSDAGRAPIQLPGIVDFARRKGLPEIAGRLAELFEQPLDDDEEPLRASATVKFVLYCLARRKAGRPLMTVTPTGELDVTWKGAAGKKVLMRFFEDGSVWVAYKLTKERGSFEVAARDLRKQRLHFKLPSWA